MSGRGVRDTVFHVSPKAQLILDIVAVGRRLDLADGLFLANS